MSQFFSVFSGIMSGINSLGSTDFFVIGGILVLLFFFGLYLGKSHLMAFIIAWYPATLVYNNLPLGSIQKFANGSAVTLIVFSLIIFFIILLLAYTTISRSLGFNESLGGFFKVIKVLLLAASFTDLLLILTCRIIPINALYHFSPTIADFFTSEWYPWLLLGPILIVFLTSW